MATITGAKGGSQKQHTPVEQPDSAQSMARCRMLLALGEGEFAGGLDATRIFLDGTPLGNADGSMNFESVSWDFRPGTQTQTPIPGFPAVENETTISVSLTKATPWTRALRCWCALASPVCSSKKRTAILLAPQSNIILIWPLMGALTQQS